MIPALHEKNNTDEQHAFRAACLSCFYRLALVLHTEQQYASFAHRSQQKDQAVPLLPFMIRHLRRRSVGVL